MQINNSNSINIEFKDVFYSKKYPFSEYTLNVTALANSIISGVANGILVPREKLLGLLEEHSTMGNVSAQERLYSFLKKPIGKIDLTNPEKAAELLEKALKQERLWAIKEKINELILAGKSKSFGIARYHIMAAHQNDTDSINALETLLGDKIAYSMRYNCNYLMIENEFSIKKYMETGFGSRKWTSTNKPWTTYGTPLNLIGKDFISLYSVSDGNKVIFRIAKEYLEKAAELGDKEALFNLGNLYDLKSDFKSALYWYTKAALETWDSKNACFCAGALETKEFHGHPPNSQRALSFFLRSAELGFAISMNNAAKFEYDGFDDHAPNEEKAIELWKVSAHMGCKSAMYSLGHVEEKLYHAKKIPTLDKALFWYEKSANEGFELAALNAAIIENQEYPGHKKNDLKALKWCRIAAKDGNIESMLLAGSIEYYSNQNYEKSREWYALAANAQSVDGMFALSKLEKFNFDNPNKGRYWLNLAASKGHVVSMYCLAELEMNSKHTKAFDLFVRAANSGYAEAICNAGVMEIRGFKGHPANPEKALEWFLQGAQKGDPFSMYNAAQVLLKLNDPSKMEAIYFWLNKASDLGCTQAIDCLNVMKNHKEKSDEQLLKIHNAVPLEANFSDIISLPSKKSDADQIIIEDPSIFKQELPIEVILNEEENWEDALSDELTLYFDFSKYQQTEVDASIIRSQYQKIEEINNKINTFTISLDNLSSKNKLIWDSLNESNATVTLSELIHFANDEVFDGQFFYTPTASGIMFCLSHQRRYGTVSTHRKHNKSYKGVDKNFAREFRDMVRNVLSI